MPTRSSRSTRFRRTFAVGLLLVLLPTGAMLLRSYGPGNMWLGFLIGGAVTVVVLAVARWRSRRFPHTATTAERIVSRQADERDIAVQNRSLATLGAASIPLASLAGVAVAVGAPAAPVLAGLLWLLLGVGVFSFWRANRAL